MTQMNAWEGSRRGNAAFGLIGILIVTGIVLFIMFGTKGQKGQLEVIEESRETAMGVIDQTHVYSIGQLVVAYKLENNRMPESMEDLPGGDAVKDRWGQSYRFRKVDEMTFELISAGRDGEFETEDDLVAEGRSQV